MKTRNQTRINDELNTECSICLQNIKYIVNTVCNHSFCDDCLTQHLLHNKTCPLCRMVCDPKFIIDQIPTIRNAYVLRKLESKIANVETVIETETIIDQNMIIPPNPLHLIVTETIVMSMVISQLIFIVICINYIVTSVREYIESNGILST